jgi:hypothetical protein
MRLRHRLYSRKDTVKGHDHQWFQMAISTLSRAGQKKIRHAPIILKVLNGVGMVRKRLGEGVHKPWWNCFRCWIRKNRDRFHNPPELLATLEKISLITMDAVSNF